MRILVTGNNGYIGTLLTQILLKKNFSISGLDNNYFEKCNLARTSNLPKQIIKDIKG